MDDLITRVRAAAAFLHESGTTSTDLYAHAKMQEMTGFGASAPYTSLLAQAVAELENRSNR